MTEIRRGMYKVLIVENNPVITKLLSHFFQAQGCDIRCAPDGLEAINIMESYVPDILFTDIIMPKISGEVLCRIVRESQRLKDVFVVVHSAIACEGDDLLYNLDADLYIAKGPDNTIQKHVHSVMELVRTGKRRAGVLKGTQPTCKTHITKELLLSRRHYYAIMENLAEAVVEMDTGGRIVEANKAALKLLTRDFSTLVSSSLTDYLSGPGVNAVKKWLKRAALEDAAPFYSGYEDPLSAGSRKIILNLVRIVDKETPFFVAIFQDITSQKKVEEQLSQTVHEFDAVMESIDYGVLFMDADLRARIANKAFREMWGYPEELFTGRPTYRELIYYNRYTGIYNMPDAAFDDFAAEREALVKAGISRPKEFSHQNGKVLQYQCVVLPGGGRMLTYFDITEYKETQAQLAKALKEVHALAHQDPLTGLPNIRLLQDRFYFTSSISKRKNWKAAILFLDLDGFKSVNDTYGHRVGDMVLKMVAERLRRLVREADTVARIGGDEFLIILSEIHDKDVVRGVAEKILRRLTDPFERDGVCIAIGASIGIAMYPTQGDDFQDLIKKADNAMYEAKRRGKQTYVFAQE